MEKPNYRLRIGKEEEAKIVRGLCFNKITESIEEKTFPWLFCSCFSDYPTCKCDEQCRCDTDYAKSSAWYDCSCFSHSDSEPCGPFGG